MEAKYIKRLEQVVRVLEELPREKRFDLRTWMTCGTTACACGWAGMDPWFWRRGFKTRKVGRTAAYDVSYKSYAGMWGVRLFFGLTPYYGNRLFSRSGYGRDGSKRAVIRRLKAFVRGQREASRAGNVRAQGGDGITVLAWMHTFDERHPPKDAGTPSGR